MATFTEFCCRSGGSNLNAGTRTGSSTVPGTSPDLEYASGSWVASTGVFTVASGNPVADGVQVGDFASVYADGATTTGFVGRVTARDSTTITVSLTAKAGTAPADGTNNRTLRIGGAWAGPSGSNAFPFNFVQGMLTNAAGDPLRVNYKNDAVYSVTAQIAITSTQNGPTTHQGFSTSYGDLGRAIIDGGTTGASYILVNIQSNTTDLDFVDLTFRNNGATGSQTGFQVSGSGIRRIRLFRVRVTGMKGIGILLGGVSENCLIACEADNNGSVGIGYGVDFPLFGCVSHHNASHGFYNTVSANNMWRVTSCISYANGGDGFRILNNLSLLMTHCDAYGNSGHGLYFDMNSGSSPVPQLTLFNSNFVKNGGYGILSDGKIIGHIRNCGFGSGTMANTSGQHSGLSQGVVITDTVTYTADTTPWQDPDNGDFRIASDEAIAAGYGFFLQEGGGGTVGYPDIGAAQALASGGGGTFPSQGLQHIEMGVIA